MPRQARIDAPGTLHHVIFRGIENRSIVDDGIDRAGFVSRMGKLAAETQTAIYAWALLDNHAHILLRSSPYGLSRYMRRLLTGHAVVYNQRHNRHGHLFQNRYKSIVCDEEAYFLELVRYIHLNPLRAGQVQSLDDLASWPWCGHGALMGKTGQEWQDTDSVLTRFGKRQKAARHAYQVFVADGVPRGRRPELVGGGLFRSQGGRSGVETLRREGLMEPSDDRILGGGAFVERIIQAAEEIQGRSFSRRESLQKAAEFLRQACTESGVNLIELQAGSRRGNVPAIRSRIAHHIVHEYGLSLAESARWLGVSTSGISRILSRGERS
jgi:REP element-mobilizing transposase RayT